MDYIRFSISNPVKVTVGVLLILLFGMIAVVSIPIQLTPNVDQPIITVATNWKGRSPLEVEREIVEEQEDKLKAVADLRKMTATAFEGQAEIELEFYVGSDMTRATQEVSDKLREVPEYPDGADEPVINVSASSSESPIAWMVVTSENPAFDVESVRDAVEDRVKPYLERIKGISEVRVYGGREREVHVQVDPHRMAQRGITFSQLHNALRQENVNTSAGNLAEGRRDVRIRTVGEYDNLDKIRQTIVASTPGGPIRVQDLGEVVLTLEKPIRMVRSKGKPALALPAYREAGANVMEVMAQLRQRVKEIQDTILPDLARQIQAQRGLPESPKLKYVQVYDETTYIDDAIQLVQNNLWLGGSLAALVLWLFLKNLRPTLVVALAIPVSVIGTFVVMTVSGRSLNVISLAGLSFAVGMVVDNAIVVLENIDRHLNMGQKPMAAAYEATKEVWGAILASTLTTLAVFIPILTIQEEAGQLFRDIALAICAAVTLSLLISITVIPSASARWLRPRTQKPDTSKPTGPSALSKLSKTLSQPGQWLMDWTRWVLAPSASRVGIRLAVVGGFTGFAFIGAWLLMPPATYLPAGNKNLVFGAILTPPAYTKKQDLTIGQRIESMIRPYWEAESYADTAGLEPVKNPFTGQTISPIPPIENYFFVSFSGGMFTGAISEDKQNVQPLGDLLTAAISTIPAAYGGARQASLFGRGLGGANAIDVELSGTDLGQIRSGAATLYGLLGEQYGFQNLRPKPTNFNLLGPELRVEIDRIRAADLGIDVSELGLAVQALVDGAEAGEYRLAGESIDIKIVRAPSFLVKPDTLETIPVAVRDAADNATHVVPLRTVARVVRTHSPQQIKRIEELRAVSIEVSPPPDQPLESVSANIQNMVDSLRESGQIAPTIQTGLAGTADKLTQVRQTLLGQWQGWRWASIQSLFSSRFFLALLVTFLLMAALFESFLYPFVIMFTVPLATVGGFMGLALIQLWYPRQHLDVLTMLGFVILIGVVVNNAILIVHQALNFMKGIGHNKDDKRQPLPPHQAITEAVHTRMRPVFMTTLTSVFGMLPLVLMPGSGSELYKGLGSVVVGGLLVATVFTLVVVPLVFSLVLDAKSHLLGKLGGATRES